MSGFVANNAGAGSSRPQSHHKKPRTVEVTTVGTSGPSNHAIVDRPVSTLMSVQQTSSDNAQPQSMGPRRPRNRGHKRPADSSPALSAAAGSEGDHENPPPPPARNPGEQHPNRPPKPAAHDNKHSHRPEGGHSKPVKAGAGAGAGASAGAGAGVANASSDDEMEMEIKHSILEAGHMTNARFADLPVNELTKRGIATELKYTFMTDVQQRAIPEVLKQTDVFVKAKTGTGKTLAFLIPAIEVLLAEKQQQQARRAAGEAAAMILVLSPTRELASQIATEGQQITKHHAGGFQIVTVVGGTNLNKDQRALATGKNVDILVATPGRLIQHFEETPGFVQRLQGVRVLIFDEADRLLDMGFKRDIERIMQFLGPRTRPGGKPRQTLLFSATYSTEMRDIAKHTMAPGYQMVDTVGEEDDPTHSHVQQSMIVVPLNRQPHELLALLDNHIRSAGGAHKVIVFFATARQTGYMATLFNELGGQFRIHEIHSRRSQAARTKASDDFRAARSGIMFSSDVTARGMDYPDVTLVIQVGLTNKEQYIHRIGRTARAGKSGSGVLMCAPFEQQALTRELRELPLQLTQPPVPTAGVAALFAQLDAVMRKREVLEDTPSCWAAWLGFYNSNLRKLNWSTADLVTHARLFAESMTLADIPELEPKTIGKMGLKGVPGLRVMSKEDAMKRHEGKHNQRKPQQQQQQSQSAPAQQKQQNQQNIQHVQSAPRPAASQQPPQQQQQRPQQNLKQGGRGGGASAGSGAGAGAGAGADQTDRQRRPQHHNRPSVGGGNKMEF